MVASTPATLEDRIKNWKTRIEDVEDEEDKEIVEPALKLVIAKEKELGNDALTVDQLIEKAKKTDDTKDDIKAEKIDDKLENEQQKLSTSIAILFDYLGDVDSKVKNHTGKLLSQDALVKSGDKKLTLKTSTKDLSFVGHRAKETVSNKTGIIVSSKEGNNYTKAIDVGKKSVEDEYKKLNKITNIEERRKTIGHVPEHDKFKPVIESATLEKGKIIIKYKYDDPELKNAKFTSTIDINPDKDGIKADSVQSHLGENLILHNLGRGKTDSANFEKAVSDLNKGSKNKIDPKVTRDDISFDASHVLANMFMGSGYKTALNLITTSSIYNQETMRTAEDKIKKDLKVLENVEKIKQKDKNAYISFDLKVTARWDEISDNEIIKKLRDEKAWSEYEKSSKEKQNILAQSLFEQFQKVKDPVMCQAVEYEVIKVNVHSEGNKKSITFDKIETVIAEDKTLKNQLINNG